MSQNLGAEGVRPIQPQPFHIRQMAVEEANLCKAILRSLPEWFGMEEGIFQYRRDLVRMETLVAETESGVIGFLTINQHNAYTAEIQVMAVKKEFHRLGIGRALLKSAEELLRSRATEYFEVKTLGPSMPYASYEQTRAFYTGMGFRPIEENSLWGEESPCLIMVKHLSCQGSAG